MFEGIPSKTFYTSHEDKKTLKRKINLGQAENRIHRSRVCDAFALSKRPRSIVLDVPLVYKVFGKQNDAILFAEPFKGLLKVFAFETDSSGRRNFIVCHPERYWTIYESKDPTDRHVYEVIVEYQPCKLYFDIEYKKRLNENVNSEELLRKFKDFLLEHLKKTFGRELSHSDIIDLDSSSELKFSRHLILDLVFVDNYAMGNYVKVLVNEMFQDEAFKVKLTEDQSYGIFVDQGVYTKNRNFRIYLSSKFGKHQVLDLASPSDAKPKEVFMKSLVTNTNTGSNETPVVFGESRQPKSGGISKLSRRSSSVQTSLKQASPFPEIDDFVKKIIESSNGYIRKWTLTGLSMSTLSYEIAGGYRYCERIERHHKSNNVRFVADLHFGTYYQTCHDEDCKGFMSTPKPLPMEAVGWLILDDQWSDEETSESKLNCSNMLIDSDDDFADIIASKDFEAFEQGKELCKSTTGKDEPNNSNFFDDDEDAFLVDVANATEFLH